MVFICLSLGLVGITLLYYFRVRKERKCLVLLFKALVLNSGIIHFSCRKEISSVRFKLSRVSLLTSIKIIALGAIEGPIIVEIYKKDIV